MTNSKYQIDEDGVIHRDTDNITVFRKSTEDLLYEEYNKLVYDLSHPERFSPEEYKQKQERRAEIEQSGYDFVKSDFNPSAFAKGNSLGGISPDLIEKFKQRNSGKK
ncbi:MAG: hypothetical protein IJQ90_04255 [Alphaproteobacteria bacterium]|nr:hypothetical protein [Alphaproteobacteria bacterium]